MTFVYHWVCVQVKSSDVLCPCWVIGSLDPLSPELLHVLGLAPKI